MAMIAAYVDAHRTEVLKHLNLANMAHLERICKFLQLDKKYEKGSARIFLDNVEDIISKDIQTNLKLLEESTTKLPRAIASLEWDTDLRTISIELFRDLIREKMGIIIDIDPEKTCMKFKGFTTKDHEKEAKKRLQENLKHTVDKKKRRL